MKTLYMIGNTHFDPVWLWTYDEGMASIRATFRSALERMKEDENFIYSFSCPPVFEWIKEVDPDMFNEIKQRVSEGRWDLCEGWWLQPDCYSASGESYVRQGLYGQAYLKENFSVLSDTVFNVDSFGHSPMLPQILAKSGIKNYCFMRPEQWHTKLKSPLFKWKSPDGSAVNAYRVRLGWQKDLKDVIDKHLESEENSMIIYGVTDHGGAPTKEAIKLINQTEQAKFSTVSGFFNENKPKQTLSKELTTKDFGVYVNHQGTKKLNRKAEYALLNAEKSLVFANKNKTALTRSLWHDIMFNQFHDILGGASIKVAYEDSENLYGRVISTAKEILNYNIQSITKDIKTLGKNENGDIWNVVVWNFNGAPFNGYIEVEVQWAHEFEWYEKGIELVDESGKVYPCQIIEAKAVIPRFRSRFVCKVDPPSFGYKLYKVVRNEKSLEQFDEEFLNSERLQKILNTFVPVCYKDNGDTWCFNVKGYAKKLSLKHVQRSVVENGELRKIVKDVYKFKNSLLTLYYVYYVNEDYFDVKFKVNWNEKHIALKLETQVDSDNHVASVPYGKVNRKSSKRDLPVGEFLETKDKKFLLDGIFAYNVANKKIGFTLLRSSIYGDLRIREIDLDKEFDHLGEGVSEGTIRVCESNNGVVGFINQPTTIVEANHGGCLPCENSYLEINEDGIDTAVIKMAEQGNGVIVRLTETLGKKKTIEFKMKNQTYKVKVSPFEIKTLLIEDGKAVETDMLENKI